MIGIRERTLVCLRVKLVRYHDIPAVVGQRGKLVEGEVDLVSGRCHRRAEHRQQLRHEVIAPADAYEAEQHALVSER